MKGSGSLYAYTLTKLLNSKNMKINTLLAGRLVCDLLDFCELGDGAPYIKEVS